MAETERLPVPDRTQTGTKVRATLITHITNILRKYPDLTSEELQVIFEDTCQFLIKKGRLKQKRGK